MPVESIGGVRCFSPQPTTSVTWEKPKALPGLPGTLPSGRQHVCNEKETDHSPPRFV